MPSMDVRLGLWRRLSPEELMLLNCGVGEDSWESLGLQGDPTSPFWRRSALGFLWKEWCWSWNVLWPPHAKSWLIGKDSDSGRDWGQEEKETTEDEMAGWHHRLDGRESEWIPEDGDGQEGLVCCDSWGRKESDTTERLNWTELNWTRPQRFTASSEKRTKNLTSSCQHLSPFSLNLDCSPRKGDLCSGHRADHWKKSIWWGNWRYTQWKHWPPSIRAPEACLSTHG